MSDEKKRAKREPFLRSLLEQVKEDHSSFTVFVLLSTGILALLLHSALQREWGRVFTGTLTLLLLLLPPLVERNFRIRLPTTLEILAYVFVFCAGVLGEIAGFYERFPLWDDILHAFNGYMFAAFGFCIVALTERARRTSRSYSPFLVTFLAFCFSMTVGVLWELFEYATDRLLRTDMQKDVFLTSLHTVALPREPSVRVRHVEDVVRTVIITNSGERIEFSGYLDVGLTDTMTDLAVNLLGALVFCVIGYLYLRRRRHRFAEQFIPVVGEL